jgi:uncharacterized membrane protein HdeD (DUF308 family)
MANTLIWGILVGVVAGMVFGFAFGNTGIGIAICIAAGVVTAGIVHYLRRRRLE